MKLALLLLALAGCSSSGSSTGTCAERGGTCVSGGATCYGGTRVEENICNPDRNPGGFFCCIPGK